ncbi:hypothetical protein DFH06DRAFT_1259386 [Mycena polygramma]|nr:hypothetical protein DFH06DRAFT_1259386 [Mycena polygramma]
MSTGRSDSSRVEIEGPGPEKIGAGSFAAVYTVSDGPVAFKQIFRPEEADVLRNEYKLINHIHASCNSGSFFRIPRGFAVSDPTVDPPYFSAETGDPSPNRPVVGVETMRLFSHPTYAMDRVPPFKHEAGSFLAGNYYPPSAIYAAYPNLCRLYFGKDYTDPRPNRLGLFSSQNFPIDELRYNALAMADDRLLPPSSAVAQGMGQILARLHFEACVNAQDVEFVLGGDESDGYSFWLIDFNQVRPWDKTIETVHELSTAFFLNDPYYPSPYIAPDTYEVFRDAYLEAAPAEVRALAEAFIHAIQEEHAKRDAARAPLSSSDLYFSSWTPSSPAPSSWPANPAPSSSTGEPTPRDRPESSCLGRA